MIKYCFFIILYFSQQVLNTPIDDRISPNASMLSISNRSLYPPIEVFPKKILGTVLPPVICSK
ncbi:CPXV078A protein [Cowpox virus]|uniref:CPXV078A protein n=1 Tax=Cowpox virus TaxID=10243 RepID=A0A5C1IZQ9_COWPX|nr:CPXV078A protein [Cowpox virus]